MQKCQGMREQLVASKKARLTHISNKHSDTSRTLYDLSFNDCKLIKTTRCRMLMKIVVTLITLKMSDAVEFAHVTASMSHLGIFLFKSNIAP